MTFAATVRRLANSSQTRASVLADPHHSVTYAQIPDLLEAIRAHLEEREVGPQDGLILEVANSVAAALTILALLTSGHSFLLAPVRRAGLLAPSAPGFLRFSVRISTSADVDLSDPPSFLHVTENAAFAGERKPDPAVEPELLLRTSGTLSAKLVVHSHPKILRNAENAGGRLLLRATDRIALPVPVFHLYGLGAALLPGFLAGASVDLQPEANILRTLDREEAFAPNVTFLTPTFCESLLRGRRGKRPYRFSVSAGARIQADTVRHYESRFGPLVNLYGSTEMGVISSTTHTLPDDLRLGTVGTPLPGVELRLAAAPAGFPAGEGIGELLVRHEFGFERYVDGDGNELEVPAQLAQGWLRTGDLARRRDGGTLQVLGRCDHSVNRHGFLVMFHDVEAALGTIEGVEETAVVSGHDTPSGRELAAYCVLSPGYAFSGREIRDKCRDLLERYAVPDRVEILDSLPRLPSGKIDRRALAERAAQSPSSP